MSQKSLLALWGVRGMQTCKSVSSAVVKLEGISASSGILVTTDSWATA